MHELNVESLTWTALLGRWIEFAQASVALPDEALGRQWRESVPHIISLQAVTFALADLERVPPEDRPHARDRAEVLIGRCESALLTAWDERAPQMVVELLDDARSALAASVYTGLTELLWPGPGDLLMPAIAEEEFVRSGGTVAVMQPRTIVMPGEPVAWWCDRSSDDLRSALPMCVENQPEAPRQVYRVFGDDGAILRDVIASINEDPPDNGFPLLVPLVHQGRRIGHFTLDANEWEQRQRSTMHGPIAVHTQQ